jgi:hypothetical protein
MIRALVAWGVLGLLAGCVGEVIGAGEPDSLSAQRAQSVASGDGDPFIEVGGGPTDAGLPLETLDAGALAPVDAGPPEPVDAGPCPAGGAPVFAYTADAVPSNGERVTEGPGGAPMTMTCQSSGCPPDQVEVDELVASAGTVTTCAPPPPACGPGSYPSYIPANPQDGTGGIWSCSGPCDLLVLYGGIYGMRQVCAPTPMSACSGGDVPIFDVDTEQWVCQPMCDGGQYDPAYYGGALVCVPC